MLEFMALCRDETSFIFDAALLQTAAVAQWPGARIVQPRGPLAALTEVYIDLPASDGSPRSEIAIDSTRRAIDLDAGSRGEAARVLAWVARVAAVPDDGSVVVLHWTDDLYPLRPGATVEELLAACER